MVLGNPAAGGPWPRELLPGFWRVIAPYLPKWAGTQGVRNVAYFGGHGLSTPFLVLSVYAATGTAVTVLMAGRDNAMLRLSRSSRA